MSTWGRLKKVYLLLAVIVMLLCAWRVSDFPIPEMPPRPPAPIIDNQQPLPVLEYEENYYDVFINNEPAEQSALILKNKNGTLLIPAAILENSSIDTSKAKLINYLDQQFVLLSDFPRITTVIDIETLALKLTVPLEYFRYHVVDMGASETVSPPNPPWGAYLNYDFNGTNVKTKNNVNALFAINIFSPYGVGKTSFNYTTEQTARPYVRLLTTWIIDRPDQMQTISLGDSVSRNTNWSGSINFGGVQWGTNFGTQPKFITFPLPGFRGAAIVPTAMDLFINDSLLQNQKVAPGVYDITNIPMIDGYGNVKIITKDILGREQIVNATYYISTTLLKKDLVDYSVEAGIIRQDLGVYSNNYSQAIAAATYGIGLTDSTTLQLHGEALSYEQAAGLTLTQLISTFGILTGSIAFSKSYLLGRGATMQLAFLRQTSGLSFGISSQYNTAHFTQSGASPGTVPQKLSSQIFASYLFFNRISVAVNYTKQLNRLAPSLSLLSGTLSTSLFNQITLGFNMIHTLSGPGKKSYFLNLAYAIDNDTYLNGGYNNTNGVQNKTLQLIRQLPVGPGYGYSIQAQRGTSNADLHSLSLQSDTGTYLYRSNASGGVTSNSLSVSGGLIYMVKTLKMARTITSSFGYVHIPSFENIGVYYENQLIGTTDKNGYAFVPNLLPFQKLKVSIDPNTVPLNAEINKYEDFVIPYRDAGALVEFQVKTIRNASFTLKTEDGGFVPEGADITIVDNENTFVSGSSGIVFVTGLPDQFSGKVIWGGGGCTFDVTLPKAQEDNPIPDIGIITCKTAALPAPAGTATTAALAVPTAPANKPSTPVAATPVSPTDQPKADAASTVPAAPTIQPSTSAPVAATPASSTDQTKSGQS